MKDKTLFCLGSLPFRIIGLEMHGHHSVIVHVGAGKGSIGTGMQIEEAEMMARAVLAWCKAHRPKVRLLQPKGQHPMGVLRRDADGHCKWCHEGPYASVSGKGDS